MKVRNVAVDDTLFLVREWGEGDGTPVLLLHGVPETSSVWRDVAPALAEQGRRVIAPDLPGLGGSSYPGPFDVARPPGLPCNGPGLVSRPRRCGVHVAFCTP